MAQENPNNHHSGVTLFKRLARVINDVEFYVSATALLALVVLLSLTIVSRYGIGISLPWTEEVARFMFIAVIFASISYAARQHRHIRITMFVERLFSETVRKWIFTAGDLIWLGFNAVVLFGAYQIISDLIKYPYNSPVLNLPMYYVYAIVPFFFFTISIRVGQGIIARHIGRDIDTTKGEAI